MNRYLDVLSKLYAINRIKGVKFGLENMARLDKLLGSPSASFLSVHVAGTNGKGSVVAKIAKGLESKYLRVGTFTSPHISTFRERIAINQEIIPENEVETLLEEIIKFADKKGIPATFFELTTMLAFKYFAKMNVDIAVVETGLGGRLDATNVLIPSLSVITSIDLDHTDILGKTLESIAIEKGGIIKPGIPVVLGSSARIVPLKEGCRQILVEGGFADVESENRAIAHAALTYLGVPANAIKKALTTKLPCRKERVHFDGREVILDVAHNPHGLERLFKELNIPKRKLRVVFALSKTKDLLSCLDILQTNAQNIHLPEPPSERSASPLLLKTMLLQKNVAEDRISVHKTIADSLSAAISTSRENSQELLVCGTFFIMSDARRFLGIEEPRDPIDLNERFQILKP